MTVSLPHVFFSQPLALIKTTETSPSYHDAGEVAALHFFFELVVSELCETGGKLLQHCIMCLAQWVQYVSGSPFLIVVSVLQRFEPYSRGIHWRILPTMGREEPHETHLMRYNSALRREEIGNRREYCSKRCLCFDMTN